jgi:hypothetical protein
MLQPVFNKIIRNESGEISAKLHVNNVKTTCIVRDTITKNI